MPEPDEKVSNHGVHNLDSRSAKQLVTYAMVRETCQVHSMTNNTLIVQKPIFVAPLV